MPLGRIQRKRRTYTFVKYATRRVDGNLCRVYTLLVVSVGWLTYTRAQHSPWLLFYGVRLFVFVA